MHEMSRQHDRKSRKRKTGSTLKRSIKMSAARRGHAKRLKTHSAPESTSLAGGDLKSRTLITCECHLAGGRRRCSASPVQGGKENDLRTGVKRTGVQVKCEELDHNGTGKDMDLIYPDDDSNQILPVGQFFGNLDVVQDLPRGSSTTSDSVMRRSRRQRFHAREDSDEEEANLVGSQQDNDDDDGGL